MDTGIQRTKQPVPRMRKRKASTRTAFVVKQRNDMVTDLEKCCDVVDPATSQPSKWTTGVFPLAERNVTFKVD